MMIACFPYWTPELRRVKSKAAFITEDLQQGGFPLYLQITEKEFVQSATNRRTTHQDLRGARLAHYNRHFDRSDIIYSALASDVQRQQHHNKDSKNYNNKQFLQRIRETPCASVQQIRAGRCASGSLSRMGPRGHGRVLFQGVTGRVRGVSWIIGGLEG
jgi:heme oxygenase